MLLNTLEKKKKTTRTEPNVPKESFVYIKPSSMNCSLYIYSTHTDVVCVPEADGAIALLKLSFWGGGAGCETTGKRSSSLLVAWGCV